MFEFSYTFKLVMIATAMIGAISGILGVFLTLSKKSLVSDALSHSALPGVVLAFIITKEASGLVFMLGAFVASVFALILIGFIKKYGPIKNDTSLALILSSFFGFGQVLLSLIRDTAGSNQARLNAFIFGQAATINQTDVFVLYGILFIVILVIVVFYRPMKLYVFDPVFYHSLGYQKKLAEVLINFLLILVVISGIQMVGVILMSALLIAPAIAARLLSNQFKNNLVLAMMIGILSAVIGTFLGQRLPTGPVIVVITSSVALMMLLFSKNGLVRDIYIGFRFKKQIKVYLPLILFYETNEYSHPFVLACPTYLKQGYVIKRNNDYVVSKEGVRLIDSLMGGIS
jgi:manganese/zinc/iron transport system permease protein